jgi:leucyl aminopeptidase
MQIRCTNESPASVTAGALVLPLFADKRLEGALASIDDTLGGAIATIFADNEISGKTGEEALLRNTAVKARRVLLLGMGKRDAIKEKGLTTWAGSAVRKLGRRGVRSIAFVVPPEFHDSDRAAAAIVEGAIAAILDTTMYRTDPDQKKIELDEIVLIGAHTEALQAGGRRGQIIGEAVNFARVLALTPANDMTPTILADNARQMASRQGLNIDVLDEARMKEMGMNSLLGVSQGSAQPATLTVITYEGDPGNPEKLAFVGKAITFDSGGISIKPADRMHEMKYDMCGGAAVIATMGALAQLKPKINIIGVIPSSENMPSSTATKPGDIHKAMSGKTIEIINTDAEGRLILADALHYAKQLGATRIIDCATLTGACVVALGHAASGGFTNDQSFYDAFASAAHKTSERYWQLPLYDEYKEDVKSEIADLRNSTGRPAGTCTAAAFLQAFVGDTPWIHLDIAGTAYTDNNGAGMAKGPTGTPVRSLVSFALEQAAR